MASSGDNNNDNDSEMGFQHRGEMNSGSMFNNKSSSGSGHLFGSGWDPLENFAGSSDFNGGSSAYPIGLGLLHQYQSVPRIGDLVPKLGFFESGSFSEMVNPFVNPNLECGAQTVIQENSNASSLNRREKRRAPHFKNDDGEQRNDVFSEKMNEQDEKKQKTENGNGISNPNLRGKKMGKQPNDNCDSGGALKDYIHVRAKRGQATNSHSLAERVRREKISERMKLLQELVPGCNKITGKTVMLDEIINYVQMLQQQVEFLSMKLATVNPEPNIEFDRILSKDILHPHGSLSHIPTTTPPFHPQPAWDNDLHNLLQMGFDSNPGINNLEPNGRSKLDL